MADDWLAQPTALATNMIALRQQSEHQRALEQTQRGFLDIARQEEVRHQKAFDYEQQKRDRELKELKALRPITEVAPQLDANPNLKKLWVDAAKKAGYDYVEENGVSLASGEAINFIKKQMTENVDFMKTSLEAAKMDSAARYQVALKEKTDAESKGKEIKPEIIQRFNAAAKQYAGIINGQKELEREVARQNIAKTKQSLIDQGIYASMPSSIKTALTAMENMGDEVGWKEVLGKWAAAQTTGSQAYKPGHIQYFENPEGGGIYREYQANGMWVNRPELGGKVPPKGFSTMEEAVSEANKVLAKTPPDSGLVASAELGPANKWIPKLMPNITLRIPALQPTPTPGIFFDRREGKYYEVDESGNRKPLSSGEAKSRRLEFMEEQPVSDIKTMQQSVPSVLQLLKQSRSDMDKAMKSLGPMAGRWSEFYSGRVGAPNPEFRRLMTDIGLLQTRLMKMHVGARGGVEMMTHFKNYFNAAKDSPENLMAAFDAVEEYAKEVGMPLAEQKKAIRGTGPSKKAEGNKIGRFTVEVE